jgi:hypothetical protein
MTLDQLRESVNHLMTDELRNSIYYGSLMLNGGNELAFRSLLLSRIQELLPENHVAVTEYTMPGYKNKRADIAILKREENHFSCSCIVELKANFLCQAKEAVRRVKEDVEKWQIDNCPPVLLLCFILEGQQGTDQACLKPYARVKDPSNNTKKLTQLETDLLGIEGVRRSPSLTYLSKVPYPIAGTEFATHFHFFQNESRQR